MPPQQLLSEQAAFSKHLFTQGYPLWSPDPELLPQSLQSVGLRIGDVGTVDEQGGFDVFFNILDPLPGGAGSPPIIPPVEDNDIHRWGGDLLPREVVSSPDTPWDVDQLEISNIGGITRRTTQYGATLSDDGAHIILPQGAEMFELGLTHRQLFENYAREHGAEWLERFRDRLGWPRSNSLYLLTGFYRACSWSIASFGMQTAANTNPVRVHCTLLEVDERLIRGESVWQPAGRFKRKIGPPPDRQGRDNQTIFIRGITVTPNLAKQEGEQRGSGLFGMFFPPALFLNRLAGDTTNAAAAESPKRDVIIQHVPPISQASHPSEVINQYLLSKEPSAKVAVTHDDQWIALLESLNGQKSKTLDCLANQLETLLPVQYSISTHNDTVYLIEKGHGLPTHFDVDRSHSAGDLASDISSGEKPSARGPLADLQRVTDPRVPTDEPGATDGSPSNSTNLSPGCARRFSDSSVYVPQPLQGLDNDPSSSGGSAASSHDTPTTQSCPGSTVADSSSVIATSSGSLNDLGNSFIARFQRFGELGDLEQAILSYGNAVNVTPDGLPVKHHYLNGLGNSLLMRFERLGAQSDLDQAISRYQDAIVLTPNGHPDTPTYLNNLGSYFLIRFQRVGDANDINQAVSRCRNALDVTSDTHPDKPIYLNNLSNVLLIRFEHFGELDDLEQAISLSMDAVSLTSGGHPDKGSYLNNLGNALLIRFKCLGDPTDLENAISRFRGAVNLTPDDHPCKPRRLSNLGNSFVIRFEHLGKPNDLEQAISRYRDAVNLSPDDHPVKPSYLSHLSNTLLMRFEHFSEPAALDEAISRTRDAVDLIPDDHPVKPRHLNNLGSYLLVRYEHLGQRSDLWQAILKHQRAVDLTPEGHSDKPSYQSNLTNSLLIFKHLRELGEQSRDTPSGTRGLTPDSHHSKPT